jgi:hypothetical protein
VTGRGDSPVEFRFARVVVPGGAIADEACDDPFGTTIVSGENCDDRGVSCLVVLSLAEWAPVVECCSEGWLVAGKDACAQDRVSETRN